MMTFYFLRAWFLNIILSLFLIFSFVRYLIKFLGKLSENSEVNKMNASNIAIVIAPNIIWSPEDEGYVIFSRSRPSKAS